MEKPQAETKPRIGTSDLCGQCKARIYFDGDHWIHFGDLQPRHVAIPEALWAQYRAEREEQLKTEAVRLALENWLTGTFPIRFIQEGLIRFVSATVDGEYIICIFERERGNHEDH